MKFRQFLLTVVILEIQVIKSVPTMPQKDHRIKKEDLNFSPANILGDVINALKKLKEEVMTEDNRKGRLENNHEDFDALRDIFNEFEKVASVEDTLIILFKNKCCRWRDNPLRC